MRLNRTYALAIALLAPGAVSVARAADCETWSGNMTDRWPGDATVSLTLCPDEEDADFVTGNFSYVDERAGTARSTVIGWWDETHSHLTLSDETIVEAHALPGWRLCASDSYDLDLDGETLAGSFNSDECEDWGTISMHPVTPARNVITIGEVEIRDEPPSRWPFAAAGLAAACALALFVLRRKSGATI